MHYPLSTYKEIAMALSCGRNIIPVTDENFIWPDPKSLPKDMQGVCSFNGIPLVSYHMFYIMVKLIIPIIYIYIYIYVFLFT